MEQTRFQSIQTPLQLNFQSRSIKDWIELSCKVYRMNWFQSWPFAVAQFKRDNIPTKFATIEKKNKIIGLVAIQEIKLGFFVSLQIQRGPLWFKGQGTLDNFRDFCQTLSFYYPNQPWIRRRWLVEPLPNIQQAQLEEILSEFGFTKKAGSFQTSWLDLTLTSDQLFENLKAKWRNTLRKSRALAEKENIQVEHFATAPSKTLGLFLSGYDQYKKTKKFKASSVEFVAAEIVEATKSLQTVIATAQTDIGSMIAGQYFLIHGKTVSYRVGWNSDLGRKNQIHTLMLWKSILYFKQLGLEQFDLGGLLLDEKPELAHFKLGLGGKFESFPGIFG